MRQRKSENRVVERGSKILPYRSLGSRVVGRKQQSEHVNRSTYARGSHNNTEDQREPDRQFAIGHEKSNGRGVRQHEFFQHGNHKRIGASRKKPVDPKLEPAAPGESRIKDLVLAKNQKERSHGDSQRREGYRVLVSRVEPHFNAIA